MTGVSFFLDTAYVVALADRRDQHHDSAVRVQARLRFAKDVWTTEAVLIEIGNALSTSKRAVAVRFIEQCYQTSNIHVASVSKALLFEAFELYRSRLDKEWGLTDCISFVVMKTYNLSEALTSDHHFRQAGFRALLLEEP